MPPAELFLLAATSSPALLTISLTNVTAAILTSLAFLTGLAQQRRHTSSGAITLIRLTAIIAMSATSAALLTAVVITASGGDGISGKHIPVLCTAVLAAPTSILFHLDLRNPSPTQQEGKTRT